jgi:hypothetical protein
MTATFFTVKPLDVGGRPRQSRPLGIEARNIKYRFELLTGFLSSLDHAVRRSSPLLGENGEHGGVDSAVFQLGEVDLGIAVDTRIAPARAVIDRDVDVAVQDENFVVDPLGLLLDVDEQGILGDRPRYGNNERGRDY